jgi:hypothetical protein
MLPACRQSLQIVVILNNKGMLLDSSQWLLLIGGIICTGVGAFVLFSDSFLHLLDRTLWKRTKLDHALFTTDSAYVFNRYGRGLGALVLGVGLLWIFLHTLSK